MGLAKKTMKEAIVQTDLTVRIEDCPIPRPEPNQLLIKVIVSGSNPKDWKRPKVMKHAHNSGDDIAGVVEAVGSNVLEFKPGDRVAAFHQMMAPNGSFAEYAIAWDYATFHIPKTTSYEEAATIPLAANTAAVGLYHQLRLPEPWRPTLEPTPLIIYGGSGAVGAFAIKFAKASHIHPIIAVAGKGKDFVETLIDRDKGDTIIDYRDGDDAVVEGINSAVKRSGASEVNYAFDTISEKGSYQTISRVLGKSGHITLVLPPSKDFQFPNNVRKSQTMCGISFRQQEKDSEAAKAGITTGGSDFAAVFFRLISRGLQQGWFLPHPYELIPGGLNGVEIGLKKLQNGEASAVKYVYRISEDKGSVL